MTKKTIISCLLITQSILGIPVWAHASENEYLNGLAAKTYFSDLYPGIDKNKFSSLCQFWVNRLEAEYGFKLKELTSYTLFSNEHHLAIFQFDKLNFSCSYTINPDYGNGEEHKTTVDFRFSKKEDADQFVNSRFFPALKKKKTTVNILYGTIINVENYPFEKENAYNSIYSGKTAGYSFNVKKAFDSVTQNALRQIIPGENMLAAYRDKGNRFFSGKGVVKNFETARDFYQKAWNLGDDTSGLYLGFLYLESEFGKNKLYNPSLARAYFDSVSLSGNPIGNSGIGWMYYMGYDGFPKDIQKAIEYYEKGANKNETCCISTLSYLYSSETGFINREKAREYFQRLQYLNSGSKRYICRPGVY